MDANLPAPVPTHRLDVAGMTCGGCAAAVRRAVGAVPGVQDAEVDLPTGTVTVHGGEAAAVRAAIEDAGYDVLAAGN